MTSKFSKEDLKKITHTIRFEYSAVDTVGHFGLWFELASILPENVRLLIEDSCGDEEIIIKLLQEADDDLISQIREILGTKWVY